jgi:ribonuclease HI
MRPRVVVLLFDPRGAEELRTFLQRGGFRLEERPHALFLARREGVTLTAYRTGKMQVTGPQAEEYAGVLAGNRLARREGGSQTTPSPGGAEDATILHFDGSCYPRNPGGAACYGFLVTRGGEVLGRGTGVAAPPGPLATNNVAEYGGIVAGLEWLIAHGHAQDDIVIRGDSQLILGQLKGDARVKEPKLQPWSQRARALLGQLPHAILQQVPRAQNADADELSRVAYREAKREHPEWP